MPVRARTTVVAASVVRCPAVDLERWRWRGAGCLPAPPPPVPAFKRVRPWRLSYATRQPPPPFVSRQFLQRGKGGASGSGTHPNHPQPRSLVRSGSRSVNHYPIALSPLTPSAAASFYCTTAWCRFYPRPTLHVPSFLLRLVPPRPSVPCSGSLTKMSPLTPFLSLSLSEFSLSLLDSHSRCGPLARDGRRARDATPSPGHVCGTISPPMSRICVHATLASPLWNGWLLPNPSRALPPPRLSLALPVT